MLVGPRHRLSIAVFIIALVSPSHIKKPFFNGFKSHTTGTGTGTGDADRSYVVI